MRDASYKEKNTDKEKTNRKQSKLVQPKTLHCHSQVLELLQGLLRREHIDQTDDLQAQRQAISPLCYTPINIHLTVESYPSGDSYSGFSPIATNVPFYICNFCNDCLLLFQKLMPFCICQQSLQFLVKQYERCEDTSYI